MAAERLDAWVGPAVVRTHHRQPAAAGREALWASATRVRLRDTGSLGRLVRWRIPGLAPDLTYHEMFRAYPFVVLDEGDGLLIAGLCGRIWTITRDYPRLPDAEAFRAWREPGTVRVAFGHWVEGSADGRAELVSEARVEAVDRAAALRMKALWAVIGRFERLVGGEALVLAARDAERRA